MTELIPAGKHDHMRLPTIAISTGDPAGIGPEIALKAALHLRVASLCRPLLVGDPAVVQAHARSAGLSSELHIIAKPGEAKWSTGAVNLLDAGDGSNTPLKFGTVDAAYGRASLASARRAIQAALAGEVDAVVAAPQTERSIAAAGITFDGYPSFVARETGTPVEDVYLMICFDGARIVHANIAGQVILKAGDFLRAVDGRLAAGDSAANKTLRGSFAAAGSGDGAVGIKGIAVPLITRAGEHYVAQVLSLTSSKPRRASIIRPAVAALVVHKAALQAATLPEAIAKSYRLTPAELRVLLAIVELGGVPEVARALGVAASTVRTHILRLYKKTGTGREADLVKFVVGFRNPLADARPRDLSAYLGN